MMHSNRQPELYAAALVPYSAAAVALVLRMVARRKTRLSLLWEDYLAVVAFTIGTGFTFISLFKMRWGFGLPVKEIAMPFEQIKHHYFLDLWADMWMYTFSVGLSKFVILGFYWRMFSLSRIRQPIRILFVLSAGWIIARITLILMQCQPIRKFWNDEVPGTCPLTPMMSVFAAGIPHFIIEIAILLCPLFEIWRLHLPFARKIAVAAMFASGLLVCGSALGTIIHTLALDKKPDKDLTWDGIDDQIWAVCDVNLASLATSLPLLRPIFRSFGGFFGVASGSSPSQQKYERSGSMPTYGSAPTKCSRAKKDVGNESVVEFADEGGLIAGSDQGSSNKAIILKDITPRDSNSDIESRGGCDHVDMGEHSAMDFGQHHLHGGGGGNALASAV